MYPLYLHKLSSKKKNHRGAAGPDTEVSVIGIRYTSGRRGNVIGRAPVFGPPCCFTLTRKASTVLIL